MEISARKASRKKKARSRQREERADVDETRALKRATRVRAALPAFSHLNEKGELHMVDVSAKDVTVRVAVASGHVTMTRALIDRLQRGDIEKGNVFATAHAAGALAAKRTAELIPLCHPLAIDHIDFDFEFTKRGVAITGAVKLRGRTGAEMEALTGVAVAALTIYDMCKALDREMTIDAIRLIEKKGGRSGHFRRKEGRTTGTRARGSLHQ